MSQRCDLVDPTQELYLDQTGNGVMFDRTPDKQSTFFGGSKLGWESFASLQAETKKSQGRIFLVSSEQITNNRRKRLEVGRMTET